MIKKEKYGRPEFEKTAEQSQNVQLLSQFGIDTADIARHIGVDVNTLLKHFEDELNKGKLIANLNVAKALYKSATKKGNVKAQIYWLETQAGWGKRDKDAEHDSTPLLVQIVEKDASRNTDNG